MAFTAAEKRERRAAQRAKDADSQSTRGQGKPPGREPAGCYWDPRPGEPTGTWRFLDTHEVCNPEQTRRARDAAGAGWARGGG